MGDHLSAVVSFHVTRTVFTPPKSAQQVFQTAWPLAPSSLRLKPWQATAPRVSTVNAKCCGHNQTKNRRYRRLTNYFFSPDVSALVLFSVCFIRFSLKKKKKKEGGEEFLSMLTFLHDLGSCKPRCQWNVGWRLWGVKLILNLGKR